jgi:hypothetical protein
MKPVKRTTKDITAERGKNYGHPLDHFPVTVSMFGYWEEARKKAMVKGAELLRRDEELALRHAVYMICDKLARAATNPMHADNWDDIQGYARTAKMALGLEQ